ncbi:tRNA (adenosine(37)-N6)-threonylcarbamoyltransferase complex dimerization subunit type 1 TsaB [Candidatus Roizmanbacteria bacterium]|nr:tRNA (adenosine(37)-N6)-threonylcarbamoyltransferase complex dimerization subunit type 1 TsaB [Candidatus Roizmanbacteria bacterium]
MKVLLLIDTSNNKVIKVGLTINGEEDLVEKQIDYRKAQVVLPLIEELLKKHKLVLQDISEIKVNPGPGSFTGVRVGVAIANTLGYLLKIPVNGQMAVEPVYQ